MWKNEQYRNSVNCDPGSSGGGIGIGCFFGVLNALQNGSIRGSFKSKYRMETWHKEESPTAFYFFVFCYAATSFFALTFLILTLFGVVDFKSGTIGL
jgi:hypothetical protein